MLDVADDQALDAGRLGDVQEGDDVGILMTPGGKAMLAPRALRSLRGEALEVAAAIQRTHMERARLLAQLDEQLVPEARELGVSWDSIGWCLGVTGRAASMRWGNRPAD